MADLVEQKQGLSLKKFIDVIKKYSNNDYLKNVHSGLLEMLLKDALQTRTTQWGGTESASKIAYSSSWRRNTDIYSATNLKSFGRLLSMSEGLAHNEIEKPKISPNYGKPGQFDINDILYGLKVWEAEEAAYQNEHKGEELESKQIVYTPPLADPNSPISKKLKSIQNGEGVYKNMTEEQKSVEYEKAKKEFKDKQKYSTYLYEAGVGAGEHLPVEWKGLASWCTLKSMYKGHKGIIFKTKDAKILKKNDAAWDKAATTTIYKINPETGEAEVSQTAMKRRSNDAVLPGEDAEGALGEDSFSVKVTRDIIENSDLEFPIYDRRSRQEIPFNPSVLANYYEEFNKALTSEQPTRDVIQLINERRHPDLNAGLIPKIPQELFTDEKIKTYAERDVVSLYQFLKRNKQDILKHAQGNSILNVLVNNIQNNISKYLRTHKDNPDYNHELLLNVHELYRTNKSNDTLFTNALSEISDLKETLGVGKNQYLNNAILGIEANIKLKQDLYNTRKQKRLERENNPNYVRKARDLNNPESPRNILLTGNAVNNVGELKTLIKAIQMGKQEDLNKLGNREFSINLLPEELAPEREHFEKIFKGVDYLEGGIRGAWTNKEIEERDRVRRLVQYAGGTLYNKLAELGEKGLGINYASKYSMLAQAKEVNDEIERNLKSEKLIAHPEESRRELEKMLKTKLNYRSEISDILDMNLTPEELSEEFNKHALINEAIRTAGDVHLFHFDTSLERTDNFSPNENISKFMKEHNIEHDLNSNHTTIRNIEHAHDADIMFNKFIKPNLDENGKIKKLPQLGEKKDI